MSKRWQDLSQAQRRSIIGMTVAETAFKAAMLIDLKRRRANEVRGPKWLWASTALINSAGIAPAAYFLVGRIK
ncbi:hypothetical protein HH310_28730 [Actinoplanes sp. TBRC 11911]|uniref:hypothetical protein n=1 Tax=Actinoplanes sp. TBRC 11911 TaxID=2729386 RepID=UPI00145DC925|nr:hypothetical protein [Actinoplanes sp. TBRC 11911]NMO55158.1 hypothetical protein [Actinoplanes sp. TBRC 11911]